MRKNYLKRVAIRLNNDNGTVGKLSFEKSKSNSVSANRLYCDSTTQPNNPNGYPDKSATSRDVMSLGERRDNQPNQPLLVYNNTKRAVSPIKTNENSNKNYKIWLPKDRRAYHRILSGFKIAQYYDHKLRFMTLTTSSAGATHDLKADVDILVKRIRRKYKSFQYFRVRTNEGNGVVHFIFRGSYIPRAWLKQQWEEIHESWNVDIRECRRYHQKYIVNQYICDQRGFTRYSMSGLWLPKGALQVWRGFCKWYFSEKIILWDSYLYNWVVESQQQRIVGDFA